MAGFKKLTREQCADILLGIESPAILMHTKPDGDTVGSAMALYTLFEMLGREAKLLCADPIPDRLKFILRGAEISEYDESMGVVAIDVASRAQMGNLCDRVKSPVLMIDHHAKGEPYAPYYTVADAASASEALLDVIDVMIQRELISMTASLAEPLYTALCSDTGCFAFSNTSARAHIRAAELIGTGIDFADINRRLFGQKSMKQIKAESLIGNSLRTADNGKIAYATLPKAKREALNLEFEDFETAIDVVRSLCGAEVAFVVKENDMGQIKASLRSTGKNVADIAAGFGGGGHIRAAGCTLDATDTEHAAEIIISALMQE